MASPEMLASGMCLLIASATRLYRAAVYPRAISRKIWSSPLWNGTWKNSHSLGSSAQARISLSVK